MACAGRGSRRKAVALLPKARVYLDTNIFKFSATHLLRFHPRDVRLRWGGKLQSLIVHDLVTINPNGSISNPELKREAELLPRVAALAARGTTEFVINIETLMEVWGLPDLDSETGRFYNAPYKVVDAPVQYGRVMFGGEAHYKDLQVKFLHSLKHERFDKLQRITGAYQGARKAQKSQLLDAYHLWCAEHHKCDFFLSLDFKLARVIENSKNKPTVSVVRPSELLIAVRSRFVDIVAR
jgi:predicted nucleic acid-binding protein